MRLHLRPKTTRTLCMPYALGGRFSRNISVKPRKNLRTWRLLGVGISSGVSQGLKPEFKSSNLKLINPKPKPPAHSNYRSRNHPKNIGLLGSPSKQLKGPTLTGTSAILQDSVRDAAENVLILPKTQLMTIQHSPLNGGG